MRAAAGGQGGAFERSTDNPLHIMLESAFGGPVLPQGRHKAPRDSLGKQSWNQKISEKLCLFGGFGGRSGAILGLFSAILCYFSAILRHFTFFPLYYAILRYFPPYYAILR